MRWRVSSSQEKIESPFALDTDAKTAPLGALPCHRTFLISFNVHIFRRARFLALGVLHTSAFLSSPLTIGRCL